MKTIENPSFEFEVVYTHKVRIIDEIENPSFDFKVVHTYPEMNRRRLTEVDEMDDEIDDEIVFINTGLRRRLSYYDPITVTSVVETISFLFLMSLSIFIVYRLCIYETTDTENDDETDIEMV